MLNLLLKTHKFYKIGKISKKILNNDKVSPNSSTLIQHREKLSTDKVKNSNKVFSYNLDRFDYFQLLLIFSTTNH